MNNLGISVAGYGVDVAPHIVSYTEMANALRALSVAADQPAPDATVAASLAMADAATVLYTRFLKFDPNDSKWPDRDRFVLSDGRNNLLLRGLLHLTRYAETPKNGAAATVSTPEYGQTRGVETIGGRFGQGVANAVGMALAERLLAARYGEALVNHRTYVIAGAGCLQDSASQDALALAGQMQLNKLTVLYDDAVGAGHGTLAVDDPLQRCSASGWLVQRVDGHDHAAIAAALDSAQCSAQPTVIACRTAPGAGVAKSAVPELVMHAWRDVGARGGQLRMAWELRLASLPLEAKSRFLQDCRNDVGPDATAAIQHFKAVAVETPAAQSTLAAARRMAAALSTALPALLGGFDAAAAVAFSYAGLAPIQGDDFAGRHIAFGSRTHGMAAVLNGVALHGGFMPFGVTGLADADYSRPAIRLAAQMRQRLIYLLTQDAIDVMDGAAAEQLAALRAIPNLQVIRPADAVETAESWEVAIAAPTTPTLLCLSAEANAPVRTAHTDGNRVARGGYVLRHARGARQATIVASGAEVALALAAAQQLETAGVGVAVVSLPCFALFAQQTEDYRQRVLGEAPCVAVEAGVRDGWDRWIGPRGGFVGVGAFDSGRDGLVYRASAIRVGDIVAAVTKQLDAQTLPTRAVSGR
ncbi:MAG: hypothetical protein M0P19_02675 [Nevskia sp.]|jgi:transketolase|nr:hypothetical protein [Nevskia sp.]MCK9383189.1 hypothetical protein [Nevskia sp.]